MKQRVGSPIFMAPEMLDHKPYGEKCDVWSVGVIMYMLMAKDPPFVGTSLPDLIHNIHTKTWSLPSQFSLSSAGRRLLSGDPKDDQHLHPHPALRRSVGSAHGLWTGRWPHRAGLGWVPHHRHAATQAGEASQFRGAIQRLVA